MLSPGVRLRVQAMVDVQGNNPQTGGTGLALHRMQQGGGVTPAADGHRQGWRGRHGNLAISVRWYR
jgi:hypothetical protein